jgi:hypothetical protein
MELADGIHIEVPVRKGNTMKVFEHASAKVQRVHPSIVMEMSST